MFEIKDITKVYFNGAKALAVLKNVTFSIRRGEVLSIVGPSGAGKSTLLHILGGLDEPTQGEVCVDGVSLARLTEEEKAVLRNRKFGFVFQFYHLLREFSALENVVLPAMVSAGGLKVRQALKDRGLGLLKSFGLADRAHHRPSELSGGEQQRVAMARALINDPEVLFCDEPTGNLDHASGKQVQEILLGLNKSRQMTIVLVTHSPELAQGSDRILHILDGRIQAG